MVERYFLKLGGSLVTDKRGVEAVRTDVLPRLAAEIQAALVARPGLQLVVGHGSGSFGHVAAARYGTRQGVDSPAGWRGFAEVGDAAARLNRLVTGALLAAGVPAVSLAPSASAVCADGVIQSMATRPVQLALAQGLVPVVYGDVAFDTVRGGTIISTEEVLSYLANDLPAAWLLLAGETAGVYDLQQVVVPLITRANFAGVAAALGGSRGTDVTGGMASKVQAMLALVDAHPGLSIRIFSGLVPGNLTQMLTRPGVGLGTLIRDATERQQPS